jgi:hypothetical protein
MNLSLGRTASASDQKPASFARAKVADNFEYSNRVRGAGQPNEAETEARAGRQPGPRRRCPPSWAQLIAKVYQVDPLVCVRCGQRMRLIAFVTDQMGIGRILDHLGLSSPEAANRPRQRERCSAWASTGTAGARPPSGSEPATRLAGASSARPPPPHGGSPWQAEGRVARNARACLRAPLEPEPTVSTASLRRQDGPRAPAPGQGATATHPSAYRSVFPPAVVRLKDLTPSARLGEAALARALTQ